MKVFIHTFGEFKESKKWIKFITQAYPKFEIVIGHPIQTLTEYKVGNFTQRMSKSQKMTRPTFNPYLILEPLFSPKSQDFDEDEKYLKSALKISKAHIVLTNQFLVKDKSITSSLYAGLCWSRILCTKGTSTSKECCLIISSASMTDDDCFETTICHEIGHMFGLPHCDDDEKDGSSSSVKSCVMRAGSHGVNVAPSKSWCDACVKSLESRNYSIPKYPTSTRID